MASLGDLILKVVADVDNFLGNMSKVQASTEKTTGMFAGIGAAIGSIGGNLATAGFSTVIDAASDMAAGILKAGAAAETTRVAFTSMLGSGERAQAFLKDLRDFAQQTPFQFTDLTDASRKMLAFGFSAEKILPMLKTVGDAVSALGGGSAEIDRVTRALGQMQGKGKVAAQEMNQLAELGIPAWEMLAKTLGVTIPEAMKKVEAGAVDAATGINGILEGLDKRFAGGMAEQSKTMAGMWSNVKDQIEGIATVLGQAVLPTLKEIVGLVSEATAGLSEFFNRQRQVSEAFALLDLQSQGFANQKALDDYLGTLRRIKPEWEKVNKAQETQLGNQIAINKQLEGGLRLIVAGRQQAPAALTDEQKKAAERAAKQAQDDADKLRRFEVEQYKFREGLVEDYSKFFEKQTKKDTDIVTDSINKTSKAWDKYRDTQEKQIEVAWDGNKVLDEVNANLLTQASAAYRSGKAIEEVGKQWDGLKKDAKESLREQSKSLQEISTILTDLGRQVADAIVHWQGFTAAVKSVGEAAAIAAVRALIQKLIEVSGIAKELDKLFQTIVGKLKEIFTGIKAVGSASKTTPSVPSIPGGDKTPSTSTPSTVPSGGASSGMAGAMDIANLATGVVSAVGSIGTWISTIRLEGTMNAVEWNTRKSSLHLEDLLNRANEFWPYLQHLNNAIAGGSGVGSTDITINYNGDVRGLTMQIIAELQRQGLRIAAA